MSARTGSFTRILHMEMQLRSTAFCLSVLLSLAPFAGAQEDVPSGENRRPKLHTQKARKAAAGALRWLASKQNEDGSWNAWVGFKINDNYRYTPQRAHQGTTGLPHLGVTALAGMAFLSGGHLPGQGPYGHVVENAVDFILSKVQPDGFIKAYGTRMYSHAFSVLFLAEVYGMTGRADLREHLDRAIEFTYKSQNKHGGWRYAPGARDSDMSITVCQVVALREARNIGIRVPKNTIESALKYVMKSAVTHGTDKGAFLYQDEAVPFNRNSFALTAAGLTTIYQAGLYSDRQVRQFCAQKAIRNAPSISHCLSYMQRAYHQIHQDYRKHYFYYYGNYYAVQAMYTRGGEAWRDWYVQVRDDLLELGHTTKTEQGDGMRWQAHFVGDVFATSVAAIILQVPSHYLPIFQR